MKSSLLAGEHYSNFPQKYPEIIGDKNSSLDCRTFRHFVSLYENGDIVFDLGCGTGRVGKRLSALLDPPGSIYLELSSKEVHIAKEDCANPEKSLFVQADILNLPIYDRMRFCVCHGVIHHTPDPMRGLKNISRGMRAGGRLYLAVYNKSWYGQLFKVFKLLQACRKKGFELPVKLAYWLYFIPRYILRVAESKSLRRNFNIRASFEDFVMTPFAHFYSHQELAKAFAELDLAVLNHEILNYNALHCTS